MRIFVILLCADQSGINIDRISRFVNIIRNDCGTFIYCIYDLNL